MPIPYCRPGLSVAVLALSLFGAHAAAQTPGAFDTADEGQIWQSRPTWGRPVLRCLDADGDGYPERFDYAAPVQCPPDAPLAPDDLYLPVGVAIYDPDPAAPDRLARYRVYVADWANHRVAVFDYHGRALASIGGGGEGVSEYGEILPPYADGVEYADGRLLYPEGVAVDQAGHVLVTDTYNGRLQVFGPDGALRFVVKMPITTRPRTARAWPSQVAVRAGTTFRTPANNCARPGSGRIAVTTFSPSDPEPPYDGLHQVLVFDERFCLVGALGEPNPEGLADIAGSFAWPSGVAFDAEGRLVVTDSGRSRVDVFPPFVEGASAAAPLLSISAGLQYAYSATVDRRGRLLVADTFNHRVAAFEPDYAAGSARFAFDVKTDAPLAYPQMVAADATGRYFITAQDGVRVFETPALAVFDERASTGAVRAGDTLDVQFSIVVPPGAAPVTGIEPIADATGVERLSGPTVVVGQPPPFDLDAGEVVTFGYRYRATASPGDTVTVTVGARGNPGFVTIAPPKTIAVGILCASCEDVGPAATATPSRDADGAVVVSIEASDAATGASGVKAIVARFSGAEALRHPGELTFENTTESDPFTATITLSEPGRSTVEFWAVDTLGNAGPHGSLAVSLDLSAPDVRFSLRTAASGVSPDGRPWWNAPVVIDVHVTDDFTAEADVRFLEGGRVLTFGADGADQVQTVRVADEAGNVATFHTLQANRGGTRINVDSMAPVTTPSEPSGVHTGAFALSLVAADALSGVRDVRASVNGAPEAVVTGPIAIGSDTTVRFHAVDHAGNVEPERTVVFTINTAPRAMGDVLVAHVDTAAVVDVLQNDRDPDGEALTLVSASQGEHGTTSVGAHGVTYEPASGYTGTDHFTYVVRDPHGATSTAAVRVVVRRGGR